jgi:short-subunit dehydrogenase
VTTPGVIPIHIDITDPWCVEAAAAIANDVTLLINNAGMASSATLLGGRLMMSGLRWSPTSSVRCR